MSGYGGYSTSLGVQAAEALGDEYGPDLVVAAGDEILLTVPIVDILAAAYEIYNIVNELISFFSGKPKNLDTIITGQRLMTSDNYLIKALGAHFISLGQAEFVLSSVPDLEAYFRPAARCVHYALQLAKPSADLTDLDNAIYSGAAVNALDKELATLNPPPYQYITEQYFRSAAHGFEAEPQLHYPTDFANKLNAVIQKYYPQSGNPPAPITTIPPPPSTSSQPQPPTNPSAPPPPSSSGSSGAPQQPPFDWTPFTDFIAQTYKPNIDGKLDNLAAPMNFIIALVAQALGVNVDTLNIQLGSFANLVTPLLSAIEAGNLPTIGTELQKLADCICKNLDQLAKDSASSPTTAAKTASVIQEEVAEGQITSSAGQVMSDPIHLSHDPFRHHPKIAAWLHDHGFAPTPASDDRAADFLRALQSAFQWVKANAAPFVAAIANEIGTPITTIEGAVKTLLTILGPLETTIPQDVFNAITAIVTGAGPITADNAQDVGFKMFGTAFLVGQGVHLLAAIAGFLGYPMSSVWANNAELLIGLLSYDEIQRNFSRSYYPMAFGERVRQKYAAQFKPFRLGRGEALNALVRRKLTADQIVTYLDAAGLEDASRAPATALAYRPIQPRILANGFPNSEVPTSIIKAAVQDAGYTDANVDLMVQVIQIRALQTVRQALVEEAISACGKGVISTDELVQVLTDAQYSSEAQSYVQKRVLYVQQAAIAADVERDAIGELEAGLITQDEATQLLQAAGIQNWRINTTVTLGATKAALKAALKVQAEERKAAQKALLAANKTAMAEFDDGTIDATELTAALTLAYAAYVKEIGNLGATAAELTALTALGAAMIAAQVAQAQAALSGKVTFVYGLSLPRDKAVALREQVASLKESVIRNDMTPDVAEGNLLQLGIPLANADALRDEWETQAAAKASNPFGANKPTFSS